MAIFDVQQALINAGTIAKTDVATVVYNADTVSSQLIWDGSRGFNGYKDVEFQAVPGDTTGTLINFALVTNSGIANFTVGTIVAYDATNVVFFDTGNDYMVATNGLSAGDSALFPITDLGTTGNYDAPSPLCFAAATRIRTTRGDVAVEDLVAGDQVHVIDGGTRPVIWIGHREVNLAAHRDPYEAQPIRIRRDAFAPGIPSRDLLVSPDHAVFVDGALIPDGVLIPARLLVNGATIVRETRLSRVHYFHVELDQHAVVFSDDLPSESYLDTGNRGFFQNAGAVVDLNVGFVSHRPVIERDTACCRPFVYAAGSVRPVWNRLARRAEQLGYLLPSIETTTDPAPTLSANGRVFRPIRTAPGTLCFMVPSNVTELRLLSRAARPCDTRPWIEDHRRLGISVNHIRIRNGHDDAVLPLDGPALGRGWWALERDGQLMSRWTDGDAELRLPNTEGASRILEIQTGGEMTYPLVPDIAADLPDVIARSA